MSTSFIFFERPAKDWSSPATAVISPVIDAHVDRAVLLERGLAVEARIPDEKDRLSAFEMDRHGSRIEDRERQLAAIARVDVKAGDVDQTTKLDLCPDRNEGERVGRDGHDLVGEQEGELTRRDGERIALGELADCDRGRISGLIIWRHIDFGADDKV